jgi:hypothetical protein
LNIQTGVPVSIVTRPLKKREEQFIEAAPDGQNSGDVVDGKKSDSVQITLRIGQSQLDRLTAVAERQGITRAAYMKRAVFIQLEADEKS